MICALCRKPSIASTREEYEALTGNGFGAVVQNLNADKARLLLVPLPPLTEQRRIVARVDELMALCDQLEVSIAKAETTRSRLLGSTLHETVQASTTTEELESD